MGVVVEEVGWRVLRGLVRGAHGFAPFVRCASDDAGSDVGHSVMVEWSTSFSGKAVNKICGPSATSAYTLNFLLTAFLEFWIIDEDIVTARGT